MSRTALGRRLPGLQLVAHPLRLPADVGVAWVRAVARTRLDPRLALPILGYRVERFELEVPLTIAWGDRDRVTPPAQARRAARLIPGARHVTLTSCGHVPMFDDPQQVAQAILG
jgi:pimeloyl-ACP methyl ester carboxylesterase